MLIVAMHGVGFPVAFLGVVLSKSGIIGGFLGFRLAMPEMQLNLPLVFLYHLLRVPSMMMDVEFGSRVFYRD